MAVDDSSVSLRGDSGGAVDVLEIEGLVSSLGIKRISCVRASERERDSSSIVDTHNGDSISSLGRETREIGSRVERGHSGGGSSGGSVSDLESDGLSAGICPGQAQIEDVVGVIRSESTSGEVVGEVDGCWWQRMGHCDGNCARNCGGEGVGSRGGGRHCAGGGDRD